VFARGLAPTEVAARIAQQLGYGAITAGRLVARCGEDAEAGRAPSVVVDAVDESSDPRALVSEVIVPLADAGARVAVGALRKRVGALPVRRLAWVDLDGEFADEAITPYVARRLSASGYAPAAARAIGAEVAARAQRNFLYAELVARVLADPDRPPIDAAARGWRDQIPTDVSDAFWEYLDRLGDDPEHVLDMLHPLARARGEGLSADPPDLWLAVARALRPHGPRSFDAEQLRAVAANADDYLVLSADSGALRLYHEGLADTIARRCAQQRLIATSRDADQAAIQRELDDAGQRFVDALIAALPDPNASCAAYAACDRYLRAHVAGHLADAGRAEELLDRPGLLLCADHDDVRGALVRGALVRGALSVSASGQRARVAVVHALARPAANIEERAAALRAALRRQGERARADALSSALGADARLPYELLSAPPLASFVSTIPDAHSDLIRAVAVVEHQGAPLIISAGADRALRSWQLDGSRGELDVPHAHRASIGALAVVEHQGAPLIISAGADRALRSWQLDGSRGELNVPNAHSASIGALAVVEHQGAPLIISAGDDRALRSWQLDGSRDELNVPNAHSAPILTVAVVEHQNAALIISAGADRALRTWHLDGSRGKLNVPHAHSAPILTVAVVEHQNAALIVSAGADRALRSWQLDGSRDELNVPHAHSAPILRWPSSSITTRR
jgi:hypothetical protein